MEPERTFEMAMPAKKAKKAGGKKSGTAKYRKVKLGAAGVSLAKRRKIRKAVKAVAARHALVA